MKLNLQNIFYIVILCVVILTLVWVKMFDLIITQQAQREATLSDVEYARQQVASSTRIIYSAFAGISRTLNGIIPNIYSNIAKNKRYNSKNNNKLHGNNIYNNYRYNYVVFSHSENTSDIQLKYSTVEDSNFSDFIMVEHYKMLLNSKNLNQSLLTGQNVYKLINYKEIINILSVSLTFDKWGNITGSIVVIIQLNEFLKLNDFILKDDILNVYLCDHLGTRLSQAHSLPSALAWPFKNTNTGYASFSSALAPSTNIVYASNYVKQLDLMIFSYINCPSYTSKYNTRAWIILCIIFTTIIVLLLKFFYKGISTQRLQTAIALDGIYNEKDSLQNTDSAKAIYMTGMPGNESLEASYQSEICHSESSKVATVVTSDQGENVVTVASPKPCGRTLEVTANLLEINLSILANKINDKQLNESLKMLKSYNLMLRETNSKN